MAPGDSPSIADPRPRGRPRQFDERAALDAAIRVFWAAGYDGASIDRLCRAMRMPRASLYHLYGDKQGLFLAAIGQYVETRIVPVVAALGPCGTLAEDLAAFFEQVIALATADPGTPGCLISCVLADAAGANPAFRAELARRYDGMEARLAARFRAAGWDETGETGAPAAAGLAAAVARGLMLRARSGAGAGELAPVARAAQAALLRPGAR
ncbi:TetR/AcrR family transcriptional regulator [Rhodovulum steppense]|uniref:TetR family transcriptional regulator n=1 Tax=Rhodovulum steppense TaxID=540251 RepID=A0A4R1Z0K9_9RHOB|nr:TetR/AcrR family transcriptional regulator [Rhodovulum steppense]TCM87088.1 TetR family transcriptional regulator [Rhodovulum steppense]